MSYPDVIFDTSEVDHTTPLVNIDKEQMNRAIVNLVTNALHAVSTNTSEKLIKLRTSFISDANVIRIEIADNGVGILHKDRLRVFEPYYSTKQDGTGLGLSIVHQIITDHAGYVRISDYEDKGTLVIIELPLNNEAV
jgi:two-component system nitrogen regulation sensor histidine kinase NtrY